MNLLALINGTSDTPPSGTPMQIIAALGLLVGVFAVGLLFSMNHKLSEMLKAIRKDQ